QSIRMRTVVSGEAQCCWRARTEGRQGRASAAETQHRAQPTAPRPGRLLRSVAIHCIQSNAASSSLGQTGCSQLSRNLVCARRVRALEPCRFPETFPLKMTIWNCNAKALLLRVRMRRGNLGTLSTAQYCALIRFRARPGRTGPVKRLPVLVASLCAILADTAGATIIVVNPPVVTPVGSAFDWTYTVNLQPNSKMHSGDFFTIYDFPFADPSNVQLNTSFSALQATVQNVGTTPPDLTPIDDPNVSNVTVKLLSGEITDPMQGAQLELGKLTIRSATNAGADSRYSAIADGV